MRYAYHPHAEQQMLDRKISEEEIDAVLQAPGQIVPTYADRQVYQSRYTNSRGKEMLRVVVYPWSDPALVISVYRTDQVSRYWEEEQK